MPKYWICRQTEYGSIIGWAGFTEDLSRALYWAEFYTKQEFGESCPLASVVSGDLGTEGDVVAEYLRGRRLYPEVLIMTIPVSVDRQPNF